MGQLAENQYAAFAKDAYQLSEEQLSAKYEIPTHEVQELIIELVGKGKITIPNQVQATVTKPPAIVGHIKTSIIDTLREDEEARRELCGFIKREMGFDATPYIDKILLTKTQPKYIDMAKMKEPAADIAKTVLEMYFDDGYDMYQISEQLHLKVSIVKSMIQNKDHWIGIAKRRAVEAVVTEAGIEPAQLPWLVRQYLKVRGWFP